MATEHVSASDAAAGPQRNVTPGGAWWAVALLSVLYILSFVDRLILALLVQPLKVDLQLSDVQIGLLFGTAFALFYGVLGVPLARIADRGNRHLLITGGVLLWGLCTAASGFAQSFAVLIVLRVGLAIGEAALSPSAHSMIADLFPRERRAFAASVYTATGIAGAYGSYLIGATVIAAIGRWLEVQPQTSFALWQLVLIAVGVPSVVVGLIFASTTREPSRTGDAHGAAPSMPEVVRYLRCNFPLFGGLFLGIGLSQAVTYSFAAWGPEYLRRAFELPIERAGLSFGIGGLIAGGIGTLCFPLIARAVDRTGRADGVPLVSAAGIAMGCVFAVLAVVQSTAYGFVICFALSTLCIHGAMSSVMVSMQLLAPDRMRATFVATLITCNTLLGLGLGPPAVAVISDRASETGDALGVGLALVAIGVGIPSCALLSWSVKSVRASSKANALRQASS